MAACLSFSPPTSLCSFIKFDDDERNIRQSNVLTPSSTRFFADPVKGDRGDLVHVSGRAGVKEGDASVPNLRRGCSRRLPMSMLFQSQVSTSRNPFPGKTVASRVHR